MRDLVIAENITLDGVIQSTESWFAPAGDEAGSGQTDVVEAITEQREAADAFLVGRRTFEQMRSYWPNQTEDATGIRDYLNRVSKYVVSATLCSSTPWFWATASGSSWGPKRAEAAARGGAGIQFRDRSPALSIPVASAEMPDVDEERQEMLEALYARFNARDIEALLASLTSDVEWPNGWEGGYLHGHDEVRDYWIRQWAEIDGRVTPQGFSIEPDGRVDVTVHQTVKDFEGELLSDSVVHHVYRLRGDQVEHMEIRNTDQPRQRE